MEATRLSVYACCCCGAVWLPLLGWWRTWAPLNVAYAFVVFIAVASWVERVVLLWFPLSAFTHAHSYSYFIWVHFIQSQRTHTHTAQRQLHLLFGLAHSCLFPTCFLPYTVLSLFLLPLLSLTICNWWLNRCATVELLRHRDRGLLALAYGMVWCERVAQLRLAVLHLHFTHFALMLRSLDSQCSAWQRLELNYFAGATG